MGDAAVGPAFRFVILSEDWSLRDERKGQPQRRISATLHVVTNVSGILFRFFRPSGACSSLLVAATHGLRPFGSAQGRLWAASFRSFGASVVALAGSSFFTLLGASAFRSFFSCGCGGLGFGAGGSLFHTGGWLACGGLGWRGGLWLLWRCTAARYFWAAWTDECVRPYMDCAGGGCPYIHIHRGCIHGSCIHRAYTHTAGLHGGLGARGMDVGHVFGAGALGVGSPFGAGFSDSGFLVDLFQGRVGIVGDLADHLVGVESELDAADVADGGVEGAQDQFGAL